MYIDIIKYKVGKAYLCYVNQAITIRDSIGLYVCSNDPLVYPVRWMGSGAGSCALGLG